MPHLYLSYEVIDSLLAGNIIESARLSLEDARREPTEEERQIIALAEEMPYVREGEIDIDIPDDGIAIISGGDDNGAYVLGWVWVDFDGTALDKNAHEDGEKGAEA